MKKFKLYDTWINIGLIGGSLIFSLVKLDYTFLIGYCVVGGWQLISMIVHTLNGWFTQKGTARYNYELAVSIILATGLLGVIIYPLFYIVLFIMLFAAPFMAVYYTHMCYNEVYVKMQRPLALLK